MIHIKLLKVLIKDLKNLTYIKLKKNYGFDYNYLRCVKNVKTKYFWTIGSDDQIYKHSIEYLEKLINNLNYPDGITFLDKKNSYKKIKKNAIQFDLYKHGNLLGTISLNIIKKNIYNTKNSIKKNFGYIQLYFAIKSIIKNNNWFLILKNNITKIEHFSVNKLDEKKI